MCGCPSILHGLVFRISGCYWNALAVFLVLHCTVGLGTGLAAEAEDASKVGALNRQVVNLYQAGKYQEAILIARQLLELGEKRMARSIPTPPSASTTWRRFTSDGRLRQSRTALQRALAIREKALGAEHPDTANSLNNLAALYWAMGDYAKAEPLFRRALAISEKALGAEHPDTADEPQQPGGALRAMGDYAKAEPLYRRALAISEKALGAEHPDTATSLSNLAILKIDLGKAGDAQESSTRARRAQETQLGNILSFTSEQQRLAFQGKTNQFSLLATLGSAPDIAQAVLRTKGVVLDSLVEDRLVAEAGKDPKQREVIDQLRAAKQRYTQLLMEVPKDFSAEARQRREAELEKRAAQVEQLEAALARQVSGLGRARRALSVTLASIQGALVSEQVLVELLRYRHYLGKNKWETRYGALLIAAEGEPKWIPLGAAPAIENKVQLYRKSVGGNTDETTLHCVLQSLHGKVWAPIEKALPAGTKTVILSPDGELNFVSFATLLGADDEFLIEKYSIHYVASGRDLLREPEESPTELLAVFGNPDFGSEAELSRSTNRNDQSACHRASEIARLCKHVT